MGSGIHISHDGGKTFTKITHPGLPKSPYGKTDVAIAPSDGNRMYALIQTGGDGVKGLHVARRRDRCGDPTTAATTWNNVSWDRRLIGRAGYYIRIRVSPDDPESSAHRQQHALAIARRRKDLEQRRRRVRRLPRHLVGPEPGDGRATTSSPATAAWAFSDRRRTRPGNTSVSLPIGQMYRVTVDQRDPYWVYSDRQDDGSMRLASDRPIVPANVPSYAPPPPPAGRRRRGAGAADVAGAAVVAADAADAAPRPTGRRRRTCRPASRATRIRSRTTIGSSGARATPRTSRRSTRVSGLRRSVSPWMHTLDSDPVGLKYRCQWSPPLAIDWFDNSVLLRLPGASSARATAARRGR